jgi:hypothetical protein
MNCAVEFTVLTSWKLKMSGSTLLVFANAKSFIAISPSHPRRYRSK